MSGAFDTSSAAHPKQCQQKHLFSQQQQQHLNNNRPKTVQKIAVSGCEITEFKSTRADPSNIPPAAGALKYNLEKDDSEKGCSSKQLSTPSSLVTLEVNNYPCTPLPTRFFPPSVQRADETLNDNNNWHDKTTVIITAESVDNNNGLVNNNGQPVSVDNHHSNHRSQFHSDQNNRPSVIPFGNREQGTTSLTHLPSTSLATPLANHCTKKEAEESIKRSQQLPKGGEFAVPAVPARLKAATVTAGGSKTEETRKEERISLKEESEASTSGVGETESGRLTEKEPEEKREGRFEEEADKEPEPSTSSAGETISLTARNSRPTPVNKPFRLAFRISTTAAHKLRRIAQNHARTLRRLGINAVQFNKQHFVSNRGYCPLPSPASLPISHLRIPSRTPSPEIVRRETRQQQLFQQKQRLHHLAQQQLAVVAQQFRSQSSTEIYSPNKVSPLHIVRSTARLQPPPSATVVHTPTYPLQPSAIVHQGMDRQLQPGPSTLPITPSSMNSIVAENSPHLVDLLSNNVPPNQLQNNTASQQQISLITQQRFVANTPLQQTSNQPALTPQQRQYQQHLYQHQQQMHHQRVQQVQQNTMLFGSGAVPAIANQMHPQQTAIVVAGHQHPHPSFMMHPQMGHQQIRTHGTSSGGPSASSFGMMPMAAACGMQMQPPYAGLPQQQQSTVTISSSKANNHGVEVEEPPKKRKRISKKQQQKEEKEREQQQQLRIQQEMTMVQMQQRQQQQINMFQRQMVMQHQGMPPIAASHGFIGTPQQNYQQQMFPQQQLQQHYVTHNHQQQTQSNMFNSPPHGNAASGQYTNQQSTPPQPSPQQYSMGSAQPSMHYMSPPGMWGASPQQQNVLDYQQTQIPVAGQNSSHSLPTVTHLSHQQQQFRTPGTPGSVGGGALCYGQSPATTNCSASTPFHSPPPQQQMVGTPSGVQHTPMGGGPTPPYGNSQGSAGSIQQQQHQSQRGTPIGSGGSTVEHSRTNTPLQQQQQPFSLHSVQQHSAQNQSYQQGPPSHQSLQQQMSPADFYQQQKTQTKQMLQQSPITQPQYPTSVFPQLSDFAEDGLVDDLVVPTMSNEADDFDLDSIEPMRCGDHQQGYHHHTQHEHQHHVIDETNHTGMGVEDKIAAEIEMLPDRSPQIDDKPLSPSKLSETQDRNVTDAIASVMERVAKASSKNSRIKTVSNRTATN